MADEQSLESVRAEVADIHKRMEEIRAATEEEVLAKWQSPWRGADTVKAKVDARLASNQEYRALMIKARDGQTLEAELDPDHVDPASSSPSGHPAIGR